MGHRVSRRRRLHEGADEENFKFIVRKAIDDLDMLAKQTALVLGRLEKWHLRPGIVGEIAAEIQAAGDNVIDGFQELDLALTDGYRDL